jgi:hypothetical protein
MATLTGCVPTCTEATTRLVPVSSTETLLVAPSVT